MSNPTAAELGMRANNMSRAVNDMAIMLTAPARIKQIIDT